MKQAEIHAMRQLGEAVSAQTRMFGESLAANTKVLERLSDRLDNVDRRLIRIEESRHGADIESIKAEQTSAFRRINDLEATRDQQKGAATLVSWLRQTAPWLVAMGAAAFATADRLILK